MKSKLKQRNTLVYFLFIYSSVFYSVDSKYLKYSLYNKNYNLNALTTWWMCTWLASPCLGLCLTKSWTTWKAQTSKTITIQINIFGNYSMNLWFGDWTCWGVRHYAKQRELMTSYLVSLFGYGQVQPSRSVLQYELFPVAKW